MKKVMTILACTISLSLTTLAQPAPAEESSAQVLLPDNTKVTGSVKENIRKKGEIQLTADGKRTKYKAGDIAALEIGGTRYITHNYTFYEVVADHNSITLLRKANEPSGIQYYGKEAIVVTSEGNIDDLFVRKGNGSLQLLTKKNWKEAIAQVCDKCNLDAAGFDRDVLKKAVESCNCQ